MTNNKLTTDIAETLGRNAFAAGLVCAPAGDPALVSRLPNNGVMPFVKAWTKGFLAAQSVAADIMLLDAWQASGEDWDASPRVSKEAFRAWLQR